MGMTLTVLILAASFGFEPSPEDLACMDDTGLLDVSGVPEDEHTARVFAAFTTCTPTEFGNGLVTSAEADGMVLSEELRCFFPAEVAAASKLTSEQQVAFYMEADSPWDIGVYQEAAAACGMTLEELSAAAAEVDAITGG
jgi:hypothetical protein